MKNPLFLLCLTSLILLIGCTSHNKDTSSSLGAVTYDCSTRGYYENVKLNKQVPFLWNNEIGAYTILISELCIQFIAAPSEIMTTQEELLYWKDAVAEQATNGFIVDNNTLSTDYNGSKTLNRYVIKDKEETVSLDDTIRFEYAIPHWFIPEACHVVENNSIEHSFMGDKDQYSRNTIKNYRLTTVDEFRTQEEKEIENFLSYQICGNDYPFQWGNFDTIYLNQLLYSVSHPSRYIIYKVNLEQDTAFSLFSNIEVAFLD